MTYTNCRRYRIHVCYVPPFAVGYNSLWHPQVDGSVVIWYKYHEHRRIRGRSYHLSQLN